MCSAASPARSAAFVLGPIKAIKGALDAVWDAIQRILSVAGKVIMLGVNIDVQIPGAGLLHKLHVPGFAEGGIVPGPLGKARIVVAHGGEAILNQPQQALVGAALRGAPRMTLNAPVTAALAGAGGGGFPARSAFAAAPAPPVNVHVSLSGPLEPLANFIDARVEASTENTLVTIGREADRRRRGGRF
jgi:hypothetical protein